MEFKGKGEHSINELELLCQYYKENLHINQLIKQDLLEALQLLLMDLKERGNHMQGDAVKIAIISIDKALGGIK